MLGLMLGVDPRKHRAAEGEPSVRVSSQIDRVPISFRQMKSVFDSGVLGASECVCGCGCVCEWEWEWEWEWVWLWCGAWAVGVGMCVRTGEVLKAIDPVGLGVWDGGSCQKLRHKHASQVLGSACFKSQGTRARLRS